jgi:hypothetical protein
VQSSSARRSSASSTGEPYKTASDRYWEQADKVRAKEDAAWLDQCFADYKDLRAKWGPVEDRTRAALKAIDGADFYRDYPKLTQLYIDLRKQTAALQLNAGESDAYSDTIGIGLEVRHALNTLLVRHHMDFRQALRLDEYASPHMLTGDDAFDRNVYCYEATARGAPHTESRRALQDPWWMKRPERRAFLERYQALVKEGKEAYDFTPQYGVDSEDGIVSKMVRSGHDVVISLVIHDTRQNCWTTDKVARIHDDGTLEYQIACNNEHTTTTYYRTVTIAADRLPTSPALQLKDWVIFYTVPNSAKGDKPTQAVSVAEIYRGSPKQTQIAEWLLPVPDEKLQ